MNKITPRSFVKKLNEDLSKCRSEISNIDFTNFQVVESQSNLLLSCLEDQIKLAEDTCESIFEIKGVCAGLKIAPTIIAQHAEIWKQKLENKKITTEETKLAINAISGCARSVKDMYSKKDQELKELVGRLEGINRSFKILVVRFNKLISKFKEHQLQEEQEKRAEEVMEEMSKTRKKKATKKKADK